jgi:hypothetical protein
LAVGDRLDLVRDYDSTVNRNAVMLALGGAVLGYLQWAAAQAVAPEMDAGTELQGVVASLNRGPTGTSIRVVIDRSVS